MEISQPKTAPTGSFFQNAERLFSVLAITVLIGAPRLLISGLQGGRFSYSVTAAVEGNVKTQIIMALIYVITIAFLLYRKDRFVKLCSQNYLLIGFILLVGLSPTWAEIGGLSARRSIALLGNTLFAFYLVTRFSPREFLEILGWAFAITLTMNIAAILLLPSIGIAPYAGGAFRGLQGHKNNFGQVMVLAAIVFWMLRSRPGWRGVAAWCGFGASVVMVVFSKSGSGLAVLVGVFVISVPLLRALRSQLLAPSLRLTWILLYGIGGFAFLLLQFYGSGLDLIGKDSTLTNRTLIWDIVIDQGWKRPWLGSGYGSFWEASSGKLFAILWGEIGHAHNGFIEVWLILGFVGLAYFLSLLVRTGIRVMSGVLKTGDDIAVFMAMFLLYVVAYMTVAKMIPDHRSVPWVIFVCIALYSAIRVRSPRGSALPGPGLEDGRMPAAAE